MLTRSGVYRLLLPSVAALVVSACTPSPRATVPARPPAIPTGAELARRPAAASRWSHLLASANPQESAAAARALVEGGGDSLPLLAVLVRSRDAVVYERAIDVVHRLGTAAIPLLAEMLEDRQVMSRRSAIDILVDLAPETVTIQPALRHALKDDDAEVARDAARALGALREQGAPSAGALVEALGHGDPHVRLYAAEAIASIGPAAASADATAALVDALRDAFPGARWGACEALGSFGAAAATPAVVRALAESLADDVLYVRVCAAAALGDLGPPAAGAADALEQASADPAVRAEARRALARVTGADAPPAGALRQPLAVAPPPPQPAPPLPPQSPPTAADGDPPLDWDVETGRNVAWSVPLGGEAFGRPVVADGVVYVGTDNALERDPRFPDPCGVLAAFRASDGSFLWQDLAPRVDRGLGEFLLPSTTGAPYVEGGRLYYVTAECQLRCLDVGGNPPRLAWELDLCARLGVFPHESSNSDVLALGDTVIVSTSNGRNQGHTRVPSPRAPGLVAADKRTGAVAWQAVGAGEHVLHGQWCSPVAAGVGGRTQVLFGGGDGWLRAHEARTGEEVWRFDGNPKDARYLPRPGVLSRGAIVAPPVCRDGRVFIAMGDDPSHGDGPSLLHALGPADAGGDVTDTHRLWTSRDVGRVVGAPVADGGLLYVGDLGGRLTCLDAATGALVWRHDTGAPIWGCLWLAAGRLYVGNVDGVMTVLRAGRRKELLTRFDVDAPLYARPAASGDALFLATARRLYRIAAPH